MARPRHLLPFLILAGTLGLYLATLTRNVLPGDSGELIAASRTLSIAHPPGAPLYLLLGKVFASLFTLGSVAYRYNLFSALVASATLVLVFLILTELKVRRLLALAVVLCLATLEDFWLQATTADVYTLNAFFTAALLYTALLGRRYGERTLLVLGFLGGLALSHHLSLVYSLASALMILVFGMRIVPRVHTIVISVFLLVLGLTPWFYIPIRASLHPPLMWGATDTFSGFLAHITAQSYQWRLRTFAFGERALDWLDYFRVMAKASGVPLISLAALGVALSIRRIRLVGAFILLNVCYAVHYAVYNIPDITSHIFPALLAIAVLAGLGLQSLYGLLRSDRRTRTAVVVFAFLIIVPNLLAIRPRRDEWLAHDYAQAIQASAREACGDSSIVLTSGDISSFALLYTALGEPGGIRVYDAKISNPAVLGLKEGPKTLEMCAAAAAKKFGYSGVAMLGVAPPSVAGRPTRICGMVYVIDGNRARCRSPIDYTVRGVAEDLRNYDSRLLSGSYYLHLARWYIQEGDTSKARDFAERAVLAAYDDGATYVYASRLDLEMGSVSEALRLARRAVKVDPDFFEAHDTLANLLFRMGETGPAISEYTLALRSNPMPGPVYSNIGIAYLTGRDYARAAANFEKAIALDSTLVNAYLGLGRGLEAQGRSGEALTYYDLARRRDPGYEPAVHAEASLLLGTGSTGKALRVLEEGLSLRPASALLLSDVGLIQLRGGNLDSAIVYLGRALAADSTMLAARGNLALAYEGKGLTRDAIAQYEIYLKTAPPGKPRERAAEALESLRTLQ